MQPTDYTAIRVGMNVTANLISGTIDAGIGLENVKMAELEEWLRTQDRSPTEVQMLRIDELAQLGCCCCFCSILYIGNDAFLARKFCKFKSGMNTRTNRKIVRILRGIRRGWWGCSRGSRRVGASSGWKVRGRRSLVLLPRRRFE